MNISIMPKTNVSQSIKNVWQIILEDKIIDYTHVDCLGASKMLLESNKKSTILISVLVGIE